MPAMFFKAGESEAAIVGCVSCAIAVRKSGGAAIAATTALPHVLSKSRRLRVDARLRLLIALLHQCDLIRDGSSASSGIQRDDVHRMRRQLSRDLSVRQLHR